MYEKLRDLYLSGRLNDAGLDNAVARGWITQEQADQIRADKQVQDEAQPEDEVLDNVVLALLEN